MSYHSRTGGFDESICRTLHVNKGAPPQWMNWQCHRNWMESLKHVAETIRTNPNNTRYSIEIYKQIQWNSKLGFSLNATTRFQFCVKFLCLKCVLCVHKYPLSNKMQRENNLINREQNSQHVCKFLSPPWHKLGFLFGNWGIADSLSDHSLHKHSSVSFSFL